ncbi:MAG: hypothetical protein RL150_206 [Candidatus Parcubacteria bacterium]|jgi:hypothetical protein
MAVGHQTIAKGLFAAVAALLIVAAVMGIRMLGGTTPDASASIERALNTDERAGGVVARDIVFTKQTERYARGTLIDDRDGVTKTFYAMLVGDVWRIVDITTAPVSCERFARLGFPDDFIVDCVLSFKDAVTVAEIDATIGADLLAGVTLQVIGFVDEVTQTPEGTTIVLSSGGASQTVTVADGNVGIGSLVVVTVEDLAAINQTVATTQTGSTASSIPVSSVVVVGTQDTGLVTEETTATPLPQETGTGTTQSPSSSGPVTGAGSQTIYKINAPTVAPPPSYFFSEFDIDTSFENIRIDGSF